MFSSFLLALREGFEVALIIGVLISALHKMDRSEFVPTVWLGAASAAGLSLMVALLLDWFGQGLEGEVEEIFEGFAMLSASALLTWMIFWMHRQSRTLRQNLETEVRRTVIRSGHTALFALSFLSVGREGLELALFLVAARLTSDALGTLTGAAAGLMAAAVLGWALFHGTRRLSLSNFFRVTNAILILFAAGLVAHGVHEFNVAGLIPAGIEHLWDLNGLINENSILGEFLKAFLGYNGDPSLTEILAYCGYFAVVLLGLRRASTTVPAASKAN